MIKIFGLIIMTENEWDAEKKEKEELRNKASSSRMCAERADREKARLSEEISAKTTDCKVGIWCKDCIYRGYYEEWAHAAFSSWGTEYFNTSTHYYCKKHLYDLCPEFRHKNN